MRMERLAQSLDMEARIEETGAQTHHHLTPAPRGRDEGLHPAAALQRLLPRVSFKVALQVVGHLGQRKLRALLEEVGHLGQRALLRVALEEVERSGRRVLSTGAVPPKGPTRPIRSILLRAASGSEEVDHPGREVLLGAALAEGDRLAPGLAADSMEQVGVQPW